MEGVYIVIKYLKTVMWKRETYFFPVGIQKSAFGPNPGKSLLRLEPSKKGEGDSGTAGS